MPTIAGSTVGSALGDPAGDPGAGTAGPTTPAPGRSPAGTPPAGRRRWTGPRLRVLLMQCAAIVAVLAVWALVRAAELVSTAVLPAPSAVATYLVDAVVTGTFWTAVGQTLQGALEGLVAALLVGVPLGLVTGTYAVAERSSRLIVDVGRSFPVFAILPVLLLVIGATMSMKAVCVFIACVFPVWLQAQYGARAVDPTIQETARAYRIPRSLRFRKVILPSALPSIMTGVRLAATTSVLVCVGVEILTSVRGMGARIVELQVADKSAGTFAYIFACGCVGFAITRLTELAEDRVLRWRPPVEAG